MLPSAGVAKGIMVLGCAVDSDPPLSHARLPAWLRMPNGAEESMRNNLKSETLASLFPARLPLGHISGQSEPILMVIARHERTRLQTFYLNSMHGNP